MKLTMMIGIPGSGKSYKANEIQKETGAVLFCPDDIRSETGLRDGNREDNAKLYSEMHREIINTLMEGKDVIYDATNLNSRKRVAFLETLNKLNVEKKCVLVLRLYEDCIKANKTRDRVVPEEAIKNKLRSFEPPHYGEGWDKITLLYTDKNPNILGNPERLIPENMYTPHDSKYHLETIGEHIQMVLNNVDKSDQVMYYAALLHDEGKPFTKEFKNMKGEPTEEAHYYSHEHVSAYNTFFYNIPQEIKLDVAWLCNNHMKVHEWRNNPGSKSENRVKRGVDENLFNKLLELGDADNKSRVVEIDPPVSDSGLF